MIKPVTPSSARAAVLLVALAGLVGCAGHRQRGRSDATDRVSGPLDLEAARGALLERSLTAPWFDGEFRVRGRHAGARFRARGVVTIEAGGRLLLEAAGPRPFVFACDGVEIRVLLAHQREWMSLPATAASVEALIGLPLAPDELGAVLARLGAPAGQLRAAMTASPNRLLLSDGWLELGDNEGKIVAGSIRGLRFQLADDGTTLEFRLPTRRLELDARLTAVAVLPSSAPRPDPPSDLFRPVPPAGFVAVTLIPGAGPVLLPGEE